MASEDQSDVISVEGTTDDISVNKTNDEILRGHEFNGNVKENCKLDEYDCTVQTFYEESNIGLHSTEENNLTYINADEILGISSPPYNWYSVRVSDISIKYGINKVQIPISVSSTLSEVGCYKYDFYLYIYDSNNNEITSKRYHDTYVHSETFTMDSHALNPGVYSIKIVNYADKKLMRSAKLYVESVPYSAYSVIISNTTIGYASPGYIHMNINPTKSNYYYKYDFYLKIYNLKNVEQISKRYYSTSSSKFFTYHKIGANTLSPGIYTVKIINTYDNQVMATAKLIVKNLPYSVYSVHVYDTSINYDSSGQINISIAPASNYKYKYDFYLNICDSNDNQIISQRYYNTTSTTSKIHNVSPYALNPGVYTIKIINYDDKYVMSTAKLTVKNITIVSQDFTGFCDESIQFKVRVLDNNSCKSGLNVIFNCNGNQYTATTDSDGYAILKIHLKAGTYNIITQCDDAVKKNKININQVYIANRYKDVYVKVLNGYFGCNEIKYGWKGNLDGYIKIYKGTSEVYSKKFNTNGMVSDYLNYNEHNYGLTKKFSVGLYTVKIISTNGKVIKQGSFKIFKMPTYVYCPNVKFTSGGTKYITVDVNDRINDNWVLGTVQLKINGKTYYAKLRNGEAIVKISLPSNVKIYTCRAIFLENNMFKSSSTIFKITVNKYTPKKITSFTVIVPVKLNQYTSKTVGAYKVQLHKYITDYGTYQHIQIAINLYKNNKKIKSSSTLYKTKAWFHFKNGVWKYWGVNNYGKLSFNKLTYNQFMIVDKAKITVWVRP